MYLPATFKFQFDPTLFPDGIDKKTGDGFKLDYEKKKVLSKYTCGVAILQIPFFIIADKLAPSFGYEPNGFTPIYYKLLDVAAVFYLLLGFYFLEKFLRTRSKGAGSVLVVLSLVFATNLFYYAVDETGMSHVYSFALFSVFLYLIQKTKFLFEVTTLQLLLIGLVCGLIVLIRPINGLFLTSLLFLDITTQLEIKQRVRRLIHVKTALILFLGFVISILPQLLYWKYSSGSFFTYSYGEEGFTWSNPHLLQVWFSPYNGLFLYSPFYLVLIGLAVYMAVKKIPNGAYILVVFLALSYILSCWWDPGFGCSFGARSFVEYLALFSIPLAAFFHSPKNNTSYKPLLAGLFILIFVAYNLKMTYSYDGCFYGGKNWDWNTYLTHLLSPTK